MLKQHLLLTKWYIPTSHGNRLSKKNRKRGKQDKEAAIKENSWVQKRSQYEQKDGECKNRHTKHGQ